MRVQWGPTPGEEEACIAAAHRVACQVYAANVVLPLATLREWVSRNPQIVWFAFDETGAVLGYIYGIPLEIHAFNRILHPGWNEKDIKVSEIRRYDMAGEYHWYLCSLVVRPDVQHTQIGRTLRKRVLQDLASLAERDIVVSELSAETVSEGGVRCMPSFGLKLHHQADGGSSIYHTRTSPAELAQLAARLSVT